jgi:SAM-dependent methyltransferase
MNATGNENLAFIQCWNEILTPKWMRFRHLLSGNGKIHSDLAQGVFRVREGDKILDVGCGFGETCLELGRKVGPSGEVLGLDCTSAFLEIANAERDAAGLGHVRYELGDAQLHPLPVGHFDVVYSRFGVMFFQSQVAALRNMHRALKPGGSAYLIVWRTLRDNPCWGRAKQIALELLPPPGEQAATCGPGPFSMADEETTRAMLGAAKLDDARFERIDADICVGRDVEEAIDYQVLVGPAGEIVREAGDEGRRKLPELRDRLRDMLSAHAREGGVYMASSTWAITAVKTA